MTPIKLSGCILVNDKDQLLLIHRNRNGKIQWEIPGGKLEKNEKEENGATRELLEELGIQVELRNKIGQSNFREGNIWFHYVWFRAQQVNEADKIKLEKGFDDYKYFELEKLKSMKHLISAGTNKLLELHWSSKLNLFI